MGLPICLAKRSTSTRRESGCPQPRSRSGAAGRENVQPVEQVLTVGAALTAAWSSRFVAARTRTSTAIDGCCRRARFPVLQDAQQRDLRLLRQLTDFIEEIVPPSAASNRPSRRLHRAGKRALLVPKQLGRDERRRMAAQFTRMNAPLARRDRL